MSSEAFKTSDPVDQAARDYAVDPARNVVLEASAGTGKTRVLVERYVNLLRAGIEPEHILAITFTRKAAAEMRERVIDRLREASRLSQADLSRWRDLKDRLSDIEISTIDAFCLGLLREFPLEADVDPGFQLADDTEVPRLVEESLDRALRICRGVAKDDDDVALVFAQLGERRLRTGLGSLLNRRLVAPKLLRRYLTRGPRDLTPETVCAAGAERLRQILSGVREGLETFLEDGPVHHPQFAMLARDLRTLCGATPPAFAAAHGQAAFRVLVDRLRGYFLTQDGKPRGKNFTGTIFKAANCHSEDAWRRHRQAAAALAPHMAEAIKAFRRDLNVVLSRGVWRIFAVTLKQYEETLEERALLDFSGVLERAVALLENMDEFAQSRFRLEARYRHVLVDEFQDTSRAQWQLVAQLVRSWGEGLGAANDAIPPSIFIVGDRKQSIYGFRDAEVAVLDEAGSFVEALRAEGTPRRAISVSFRSAPSLLTFVNDLFEAIDKTPDRADRFRYDEADRFPLGDAAPQANLFEVPGLGVIAGPSVALAAGAVADEIARVLAGATVRDRATGLAREAQPADIAILFRSRDSHREFEKAIAGKGISTYVYKGLGFFDADEVQDAVSLIRFLADPLSELRTAAFLRSRTVRLSDAGIARLAPALSSSILDADPPKLAELDAEDRAVVDRVRSGVPVWLSWVDRMPPSELLSRVLAETSYSCETQGPGRAQARENLKKLSAMVRRFQNRGYATLGRVADHLEELAVGDESNASLDARDSVSLMTVHASKGLEFPIVFVVNMGRGTGGIRPPVRIASDARGEASVAIADFQSEADEDSQAREREETKRLLYVAVTRARDRLYLSATVEKGQCRTGRGSLGEVLPPAMKALFVTAAASETGAAVTWGRNVFTTAAPPSGAPALPPPPG
ncbi:MAG TPA: UvrD-helicase domain-containing protein [Vicinamibacterales bacterium]|jgi:ATP-dependent helicase/nuclease subunit A|nr:UvrD-helicase domain-containing protein [Vicinamibacterales bacterium]